MSKLGNDFQRKAGRPDARPRSKGRRRTDMTLQRHTQAMEDMRVRLMAMRRDLDGALHFDHDNDAAQRIYRTLKLMLRESGVDDANRHSMKTLLRDICIHADWQDWPYDVRPVGFEMAHGHYFKRGEFADIAIAREKLKKPHDYLEPMAGWIHQEYNIDVAFQLYMTGHHVWKQFVLIHMRRAIDNFFGTGGVMAHPGNWPGNALHLTRKMMNDKVQPEMDRMNARHLHDRLMAERDAYVKLAKSNAMKAFRL